ncbi:MAG: hypothetical protein AAGB11_08950 [Pseudomonadota bacterium]
MDFGWRILGDGFVFEVFTPPLYRKLAIPIGFAAAIFGAALSQERLNAGIILFFAMMLALNMIRVILTRSAPLPISHTSFPTREKWMVTLVGFGTAWVPIMMIATPFLDFSSYRHPMAILPVGLLLALVGLWLFFRSHVDLGVYWSPVLEIRDEQHSSPPASPGVYDIPV